MGRGLGSFLSVRVHVCLCLIASGLAKLSVCVQTPGASGRTPPMKIVLLQVCGAVRISFFGGRADMKAPYVPTPTDMVKGRNNFEQPFSAFGQPGPRFVENAESMDGIKNPECQKCEMTRVERVAERW